MTFGQSYTVPIPKIDCSTKSMTCSDFRGIAISPIIFKIFEHGIFERFNGFLSSNDNQFGFKMAWAVATRYLQLETSSIESLVAVAPQIYVLLTYQRPLTK